jgi:hypothetical protein
MNRFYTVLCEDLQAFVFVRHALIRAGADRRNIFKHPFPDSRFHASGRAHNNKSYGCRSVLLRARLSLRLPRQKSGIFWSRAAMERNVKYAST